MRFGPPAAFSVIDTLTTLFPFHGERPMFGRTSSQTRLRIESLEARCNLSAIGPFGGAMPEPPPASDDMTVARNPVAAIDHGVSVLAWARVDGVSAAHVDFYLKLQGVDGDSTDLNPGPEQTGPRGFAGGQGAGKVQMHDY
jgi:hypothetical protein